MDDKEYKRLLNKAAAYCAKAEKSPREVSDKLRLWSSEPVDEETEQSILKRLKEEKFIDEVRYATKYISEKVNLLHKGPHLLTLELSNKGIPTDIIYREICHVTPDEWQESCRSYLAPKLESHRRKSRNSYDLRMRLSRSAHGRGFSSDTISAVLSTFDLTVAGAVDDEEYYD